VRWALGGALLLIVLLLALSQALLPGIVAGKLRSSLDGAATGVHLSVRASPALELLFGHADDVDLSIGELRPTGRANIKALLERTRETGSLNATVAKLITEKLELDDVSVVKRGSGITTSAAVNRTALAAALPAGFTLAPAGGGSHAVQLAVHIDLLGREISAEALLEARNGNIEIVPSSPLLPSVTLFSDPQLAVDAVGIVAHGDSYTFSAHGHLA
jgi:hypothetical protein